MLTMEDITLLRSFDTSSRKKAAESILDDLEKIRDDELLEQCMSLILKLDAVTDAEWDRTDFTADT